MTDKKQPPKVVKDIGDAIARALGVDPSKVQMVRASDYGVTNAAADTRREKTLDELFELHKADAMSVVEAAKDQRFDHACCNDCAVRALAAGQVEGAVRALLSLSPRDMLFEEVAALHSMLTGVLQDILEEQDGAKAEQA